MFIINHPQLKCWHTRENKNSVTNTQIKKGET